jgi:4-hydroxy-3-methylbut-2-enyl diphosphate reductase
MKVLLSQSRGFRAGASAPEVLADGVIDTLRTLGEVAASTLPGRQENIEFRLPRELATS